MLTQSLSIINLFLEYSKHMYSQDKKGEDEKKEIKAWLITGMIDSLKTKFDLLLSNEEKIVFLNILHEDNNIHTSVLQELNPPL